MSCCKFESVEAHLAAAGNVEALKPGDAAAAAANLCQVWHVAKPVLQVFENFPFFPANWKGAVGVLVTTLDLLCPGGAMKPEAEVAKPAASH